MSTNLYMGIVAAFIALNILSFIVEGAVAFASTTLTASIGETVTTIPVTSTKGFKATNGIIQIDNEFICYDDLTATSFTNATRGCRDSNSSAHTVSLRVYTDKGGRINTLMRFDKSSSSVEDTGGGNFLAGVWNAFKAAAGFVATIPFLLAWDYSFYDGNMVYFKYIFLYPLSAGLVLGGLKMLRGV